MRVFLLSVAALVAIQLVAATPASADCSGPSMTFTPRELARGEEVTATGEGWGDNCYDTGPPPDGQGALGRPVEDIDIVLVQGEKEWVLATVDAEDDYGFVTRATIPPDATPGDAQLIAREPGTLPLIGNVDPALRITADPPITSPPTTDTVPPREEASPDAERTRDDSGPLAPWLAAAALVVAGAGGVTWFVLARRRSA